MFASCFTRKVVIKIFRHEWPSFEGSCQISGATFPKVKISGKSGFEMVKIVYELASKKVNDDVFPTISRPQYTLVAGL